MEIHILVNSQKEKTYIVVISTKNCSGREQGACCNQKDVGTTVIKKNKLDIENTFQYNI